MSRLTAGILMVLAAVVVLAAVLLWGPLAAWLAPAARPGAADGRPETSPPAAASSPEVSLAGLEAQLKDACTYCHAYAQPETIPRGLWDKELKLAYGFIGDSDLDPQRVPAFDQALEYFRARAPVRYEIPEFVHTPSPIAFRPSHLDTWVTHQGVANLQCARLDEAGVTCVVCDMRNGKIFGCFPGEAQRPAQLLAEGGHPCRCQPADLDGDGQMDLLVADLGTLQASDALRGRVVWLRREEQGGYSQHVLLDGVGRVADVRAADFDGDGDVDLIVGVFGWRSTGGLIYLENQTTDYHEPKFRREVLDKRNGIVHVPIADLNHDGRPDFVALFTQHHEQIVAFLNLGEGKFQQEPIFDAGNPGFGCTGIELADMDNDGDLDVVLSNGDTLDFEIYRPYHGLQWLENQGAFPFRPHPLIALPGAMSATVGDLDLDGDLDVVAVNLLPFGIVDPETGDNILPGIELPSLVWLEQTSAGVFVAHVLESNRPAHASVCCCDVDGDGDQDLVTGYFTLEGVTSRAIYLTPFPGALTVWENPLR